jgi:hypothetical protein
VDAGHEPLLIVLAPVAACADEVLVGRRDERRDGQVFELDLLRQRAVVSQQVLALHLERRLDVGRLSAALLVAAVQRPQLRALLGHLLLRARACNF